MAMGAATVGLCSTSDETIAEAEKELPKNLCPLIKSSYGFAKTDKCPFFYFSDVVVGETTCDGKKKMYEYMMEFKEVGIFSNILPSAYSFSILSARAFTSAGIAFLSNLSILDGAAEHSGRRGA